MLDITHSQLIDLWEKLLDAYGGISSYNGDTTEIYAYTLQSRNPYLDSNPDGDGSLNRAFNTMQILKSVCLLFQDRHECHIVIDGKTLGALNGEPSYLPHRCYVQITKL